MTGITATEARSNLYRLIDEVADSHQPVTIMGKRNKAVLVSEEDWSAIQETLYLLSVPGMRESICEEMGAPVNAWPAGHDLIDVQDYESMQRRLELLEGLLRGERAVLEGRTHSQSEARGLAEREASRESGKHVNKAESLAALDAILERRRDLE